MANYNNNNKSPGPVTATAPHRRSLVSSCLSTMTLTLLIDLWILSILPGWCQAESTEIIVAEGEMIEEITCWTCPNKTDNEECNNWAPDILCPVNLTVCKTVHHLDTNSLTSVHVSKMCVMSRDCTESEIGCVQTGNSDVLECVSCCSTPYCNERVPMNHSMALELSSFRKWESASSGAERISASTLGLALVVWIVVLIQSWTFGHNWPLVSGSHQSINLSTTCRSNEGSDLQRKCPEHPRSIPECSVDDNLCKRGHLRSLDSRENIVCLDINDVGTIVSCDITRTLHNDTRLGLVISHSMCQLLDWSRLKLAS